MSTSQLSFSLFGEPRPIDELIWGWLGRFRDRYEGLSHDALGEILGELPSYRKGFPTRLNSLVATAGMSPEALVNNHTFFRFASVEISHAESQALRTSMLESNSPVMVPRRLAAKEGGKLRVCRNCVAAAIEDTGVAYYRCIHQLHDVLCCPDHPVPLVETRVPLGLREYVAPEEAIKAARELRFYGCAAVVVAQGYNYFLKSKVTYSREQIQPILERVLDARGFIRDGRVDRALCAAIKRRHRPDSLWGMDFYHHSDVRDWVTIPNLALICSALQIDWDEFMAEVDQVTPAATAAPVALTDHQRELLLRITADAPRVALNLRRAGKKVSVWALATALSKRYGMNLASNYAWRPEFRAVLLAHTRAS